VHTLQDYGLSLDIVTEMYEKQWNLRVGGTQNDIGSFEGFY
jgi:hypothetical protein